MKKCVIIPDSFKGNISSIEICEIVKSKVLEFFPYCEVVAIPVADGGEGTVDSV
ncbi:MAG: glycerate kinase, partial [Clostridiaceae bacterium]|nr:glycerate kinase [Clostridiaceae bacterium]